LSALKLNADRIASFDVDQFSVEGCKLLRKKENDPANWKIYQGSILDTAFVGQLGKFDIVYSWGVLHHTGDMWNAIKNAADLVAPGGFFYIALYNKVEGRRGSAFWLNRKRLYNRLPLTGKKVLEWNHILSFFLKALFRGKSPFRVIRNYDSLRGMSWRHDITDWVGGFPYECATIEEVFIFMKTHFPEFTLKNIKSTNSLGNNSFLFKYNA
jgi:2-polyprenyl-6-hydroxyphenyl methylase/3-demethylubiquinone-9 3-methyltransferase